MENIKRAELMKKRLIILTLWCCIIFCLTGCKTKYNSEVQSTTVSEEIASVEAAYQEILARDTSNYTQGDMNAMKNMSCGIMN